MKGLDFQIAAYQKTINEIVSNLRSEQLVQHDSSPDSCLWFGVNRWQNTNGFLGEKNGIGISRCDSRSYTFVPTVDYGITFLKEQVTDGKILEKTKPLNDIIS